MTIEDAIGREPERMSGALCFKSDRGYGRVPVRTLLDHLAHEELDEFYEGFPTVSEEQVRAVLSEAIRLLEDQSTLERKAA